MKEKALHRLPTTREKRTALEQAALTLLETSEHLSAHGELELSMRLIELASAVITTAERLASGSVGVERA